MEDALEIIMKNLFSVLERSRAVVVKLNKDILTYRSVDIEVSYMGHILISSGVRPDPKNIQSIL